MKKDYYDTLGVEKDVEKKDIEKAYRKLALKYHPDRNPDDDLSSKKFTEVTEAYEVLSDEQKRTQYDQYGFAADEGEMPHYQSHNVDLDEALRMFMHSFGGGFGSFFGGGDPFEDRSFGRRGPAPGDDRMANVKITLEEAAHGVEKELKIAHLIRCPSCSGSGSEDGSDPVECPECHGSGSLRMVKNLGPVQYVTTKVCHRCGGSGQMIENPCHKCRGKKKVREMVTKSINIPPGVDSGTRLRITGMGDEGERRARTGDLYVNIDVKGHPFFERSGNDVASEITISYPQAVLGSKVEVPTLFGPVDMKIPSGTQPNALLRIKGKGVPDIRNPKRSGDQYVRVLVDIPKHPGHKEKKAIKKLREVQGEKDKFTY
ncbi:MAG: molecular chaperone DnaJ [Candidatus Thermoplasmatota archaeon]|nr:molecular chaperone DnaJ [Candidatus Thermoplasmatota archaeon]